MTGDEHTWIFREASTNCDAGRALRKLIEALADANLQEASEVDDDSPESEGPRDRSEEACERASEAKVLLFQLATDITYGHRWHDSDVVAEKRVRFPR